MKIDDDTEGSRDIGEADGISIAPYHLAQKFHQFSSVGSHTALDLAFYSQLPVSTVG